ncbi:MAG TPA: hypothetical protein VMF09_00235 [Solirubrobacteraceae bacterium]|nr:hypothetical protein [Solirubrobacteraceae bacterium]
MARRYMAFGSLIAVAAIVAAVVALRTTQTQTQAAKPAVPARRHTTAAVSDAGAGTATLAAGSFTARYPAAWRLSAKRARSGAVEYHLSSTGAPIDNLGIGPAGTVGVTIDETPGSARVSASKAGAPGLLALVVGTPELARGVTRTSNPRTISLDGEEAGEESYEYTYAGRQNVQSDVLARRGDRLVLVELDAEPAVARANQAGFELLMRGWSWR